MNHSDEYHNKQTKGCVQQLNAVGSTVNTDLIDPNTPIDEAKLGVKVRSHSDES